MKTMNPVTTSARAPPINCSRLRWRMNARRSAIATRGLDGRGNQDMAAKIRGAGTNRQPLAPGRGLEASDRPVLADALEQQRHFGPALASGQSEAQRVEQLAALLAGGALQFVGEIAPRLA